MGRGGTVGIETGYRLDGLGVGVRVSIGLQTGSGAYPASYPVGTDALSSRVNRPERDADHSPPTGAGVKKTWIYTSTPHTRLNVLVLNL
jgi:hypothetical protein